MISPSRARRMAAAATLIATGLAAGPALADDKVPGTISVTATGTAERAPDMAILTLSVLREGETARAALDANTAAMAEVLAAMREAGIAERDLQTSAFSIQPQYPSYGSSGNQDGPKITGYQVSNTLTVRMRDLALLGTIIDRSVTLGVNQGGEIMFTNADTESAVTEARSAAMKAALAKAQTLAEAAGVGIGRIQSISEQSFEPRPMPMARAEMAMASAPVPIAAGEASYAVTVNVTFEIDQ